ncbi:ribbon-helix-helix protein, CopG family [Enterovirga sp. GCM10030262]|uniref:FitA-like ribbon-helix-helix domain-containing protein n=1 Tax=Enterovirga sp. GCM10030262 TaxID=3273391 RepID=UPI00360B7DDC
MARLEAPASLCYCETMKNVTVSLDDATYRAARVKAAQAGRSLSALVREALEELGSGETEFERLHREELELREKLKELPPFRASDRLTREEVHDRARERKEWRERRS